LTDELSIYLRDAFYQQSRQIEQINQLVGRVFPVFLTYWDETTKSWPYELRPGEAPTYQSRSLSTKSMILFAIAAVLGRTKKSVLAPAIKRAPTLESVTGRAGIDEENIVKIFSLTTADLAQKLKSETRDGGQLFLVQSGTYGNDDPFTLTWIAELLHTSGAFDDDIKANVMSAARRIFQRFEAGKTPLVWPQGTEATQEYRALDHAFVKLRALQLHNSLRAHAGSDNKIETTARKLATELEQRLHQHLSYFTVPDSRFDPAELAFCLEGALIFDRSFLGVRVVERVFDVLIECQDTSPYWRPLTPFIGTQRGMSLFPISVEVANSLLRSCIYVDGDALQGTVFEKFLPRFKRYADWLRAREVSEKCTKGDYAGWHSEHLEESATIQLWETSQCVIYLMHYAALLQEHGARAALVESRVSVEQRPARESPYRLGSSSEDVKSLSATKYWKECIENEREPLLDGLEVGSIYKTCERIRTGYISPREPNTKDDAKYTFLLSGPPGTGKTSLCSSIAAALGWPFINITVSDFLAGGAAEVEARVKAIFRMLTEQTQSVILLDEIDNFLLDRESNRYSKQEGIFQFMTPGMLTKLHEFRERASSILVVATNFVERIDPAIRRQGRFDDQLVLLPPDKARRRKIVDTILGRSSNLYTLDKLDSSKVDKLIEKTALFTFGELRDLVKQSARNVGASGPSPSPDKLIEELLTQSSGARPATTLATYGTRLRQYGQSEADRPDRSAPLEEFFLLVHLILEARALSTDESALVKIALTAANGGTAYPSDLNDLIALVRKSAIRDSVIASKIAEAIQRG